MRPEARVAAAIEILDRVLDGSATEQALTNWARGARYAGSKDRAAVRDLVFQAVRCRRSYAWLGGAETGRGLMIGGQRDAGGDLSAVFTGEGHAPAVLSAEEAQPRSLDDAPQAVRLDLPDWLMPQMTAALGEKLDLIALMMRMRAPVFLRVNLAKCTRDEAIRALAEDAIPVVPHDLSGTALEVTENPRRIKTCSAFERGLVELQDAASQAVVDLLPAASKVLDFCAGGGGKSLALAARGSRVTAHDANPQRMADIPARASRAGVTVNRVSPDELATLGQFDLVLCDVPCSGSGSWRRAPDGKWRFSPQNLADLNEAQDQILAQAAAFVRPGGTLAYVTCSLLECENMDRVRSFLADHANWDVTVTKSFDPTDGGDGFFVACLKMV